MSFAAFCPSRRLLAVACWACVAGNALGFVVGPTTAARSVVNPVNVAGSVGHSTINLSRRPSCFARGASCPTESHVHLGAMRSACVVRHGSNQVSMTSGSGTKTAIITGASSGKLQTCCRLSPSLRAVPNLPPTTHSFLSQDDCHSRLRIPPVR